MARIKWNETGNRKYHTGVKNVVLYKPDESNAYNTGVAWDGVTAITEKPTGAEATKLYANDTKYGEVTSNEEFEATLEAYMYPDEFEECDGSAELVPGVTIGQQPRKPFGLSYVTTIGNDVKGTDYAYEIHLVYGAKAKPSEVAHNTINESTEASTMSWDMTTTPVNVNGFKPTAHLTINSESTDPEKLKQLEDMLYGTEEAEPKLPLPDEVATLIKAGAAG